MKRSRLVIFAVLVIVFLVAVVKLMQSRFETGDVYPPYSSLRADPLGTMALAESLGRLQGMTMERWYKPKLEPTQSAVFVLGLPVQSLDWVQNDTLAELNGVLDAGGRIIVSFRPMLPDEQLDDLPHGPASKSLATTAPQTLQQAWGFKVQTPTVELENKARARVQGLEPTIPWNGKIVFEADAPEWDVLYDVLDAQGGVTTHQPVIMERRVRNGSVVLMADSFLLSNEALRLQRQPRLLTALIGDHRHLVFDEYHLGIGEDPNVAKLSYHYGLQWVLICLAVLAGLYLWKNASPLLPRVDESQHRPDITGRAAIDGLINLLRRCVPGGRLLRTCFEEWQKNPAGGVSLEKRLPQVMQVMKDVDEFEDKQRDLVGSYNEIVQVVNAKPGVKARVD